MYSKYKSKPQEKQTPLALQALSDIRGSLSLTTGVQEPSFQGNVSQSLIHYYWACVSTNLLSDLKQSTQNLRQFSDDPDKHTEAFARFTQTYELN